MTNFLKKQPDPNLRKAILHEIDNICSRCYKCPLGYSRNRTVFSSGNPDAKIMILGEAPGETEDNTGIPFSGRAGKLLDKMIAGAGLDRDNDIYICNIIKCRPPNNRRPQESEIQACKVYAEAQLELIKPRILVSCGSTSMTYLLGKKKSITAERGVWHDGPHGSKLTTVLHPSYLLRKMSYSEDSPLRLTENDWKNIHNEFKKLST